MKVAIISDPHANLATLEAVLSDLERLAPDEVIVAGDMVQGGPEPAAVFDLLDARGWPAVLGNADELVLDVGAGRQPKEILPAEAVERARWTVEQLGQQRLEALGALPLAVRRPLPGSGELVVVHATPWSNLDVVLADAPDDVAERMVREAGGSMLAYGHIHSAYQRKTPLGLLLSVGAVSHSNDQDPRPAYTTLTFSDGAVEVEVHRVECSVLGEAGPWPVRAPAGQPVTFEL
jgi:predicted phosphodiesterase